MHHHHVAPAVSLRLWLPLDFLRLASLRYHGRWRGHKPACQHPDPDRQAPSGYHCHLVGSMLADLVGADLVGDAPCAVVILALVEEEVSS